MARYALEGVRILDLTQVAVGPYATFLLASLGAQVIKVESHRRVDTVRGPVTPTGETQMRQYPGGEPGERPWNRAAYFNQRNRGKLGITLDFSQPAGKQLFLRLAGICDAVAENYRASVLERQGLGWDVLREANPHLVYLKLSSQGNSGPERDYGSLGSTLEQTAGLASITGYEDGAPLLTNETYPDPVGGILAVGALIAGLHRARATGTAQFVDFSQREMTISTLGEAMMDYSFNRRVARPIGNRHPRAAPHGVYPCQPLPPTPSPKGEGENGERARPGERAQHPEIPLRGEQASSNGSNRSHALPQRSPSPKQQAEPDNPHTPKHPSQPPPSPLGEGSGVSSGSRSVPSGRQPPPSPLGEGSGERSIAISIETDAHWLALKEAMGRPAWSDDPRFATGEGRRRHQDDIDARLAEWTAGFEHRELTHLLQRKGVPAGAVLSGMELLDDPQLAARGWWEHVTPPDIGRSFPFVTTPWRMSASPFKLSTPAPVLGEHNDHVYLDLLGLSPPEYAALRQADVISTEPKW